MFKNLDVLIVDDNEEVIWMIGNALDLAGFIVDAATTAEEGVEKVRTHPEVKAIVLNYVLPDMSGLQVLKHLKGEGYGAEVIGISAFHDVRSRFLDAGAMAFLEKPFDLNDLVRLCGEAVNGHKSPAGIRRS
ncbi:MAG: response regulator [Desulfatiglandaceae bacterium]